MASSSTEAVTTMERSSLWQLPLYLGVASAANLYFTYRAARDVHSSRAGAREKAPAVVLLALAVAELLWTVPCFLQCLMTLISPTVGDDSSWWVVSSTSDVGCGIMGFYSVFASVSGMILVTLLAAYSFFKVVRRQPWSTRLATALCVGAFALSGVYCVAYTALGAAGQPAFAYSGEGFCYIDWSSPASVALMEAVTVPCIIATVYFYGALVVVARRGMGDAPSRPLCLSPLTGVDNDGLDGVPVVGAKRWWYVAALLSFVSAWVLWIPGGIIGLAGGAEGTAFPDMFPTGYMIAGGLLGHAQAMLNPVLYGIFWRSWFVVAARPDGVSGSGSSSGTNNTARIQSTSSSKKMTKSQQQARGVGGYNTEAVAMTSSALLVPEAKPMAAHDTV